MHPPLPRPGCRTCGATSYRPVISRDSSGAMRPSGLLRCSGCSLVFSHPSQWRATPPGGDAAPPPGGPETHMAPVEQAPAAAPAGTGLGPSPAHSLGQTTGHTQGQTQGPFGITPRFDARAPLAPALPD